MREDIDTARMWAENQRFSLPLYDSGMDVGADTLNLAGGKKIRDRELAMVFPTTYVLDKHGVVVFSNSGPVRGWPQYLPSCATWLRVQGSEFFLGRTAGRACD